MLNSYAKKRNILKGEALSGDDVEEGLGQFKRQTPIILLTTKDQLVSARSTGIVQTVVYEKLGDFFEENPSVAKAIIEKALLASKAKNSTEARELLRKGRT